MKPGQKSYSTTLPGLAVFRLGLGFFGAGEEPALEQNQVDRADRDTAVGEIEHRSEEQQPVTSDKRHPGRPDSVYEREVEHIDHTPEHQRSVTEGYSVEKAVDDVAESPGRDQGQTDQHPVGNERLAVSHKSLPAVSADALAGEGGDPPAKESEQSYTEERQAELADSTSELHSESHPFILDEEDLEPIADDAEMLTYLHVRLDQDFDDLVNDDKYNSQAKKPATFRNLH